MSKLPLALLGIDPAFGINNKDLYRSTSPYLDKNNYFLLSDNS